MLRDDQLSTVVFMCDVRARCMGLQDKKNAMKELEEFQDKVYEYHEGVTELCALIDCGYKFLARFPDLLQRFKLFELGPDARSWKPPRTVQTTGKFAQLGSFLVWRNILRMLPYPVAARTAKASKWLHSLIDTELLVESREGFEHALTTQGQIKGWALPLRLMTIEEEFIKLYIIDHHTELIGMEHRSTYYVLNSRGCRACTITCSSKTDRQLTLYGLLSQIAKAYPGRPLDLCMWAKISPYTGKAYDMSSVRLEIGVYGDFKQITRTHDDEGAKHKFEVRANHVSGRPMW